MLVPGSVYQKVWNASRFCSIWSGSFHVIISVFDFKKFKNNNNICKQGEDRWLCTLILQRGWRVEYSAASDAYTAAPEGFNEFFNQRRRWMPSTLANIFDLLTDYKNVVAVNPDISIFYIAYQVMYRFWFIFVYLPISLIWKLIWLEWF